MSLITPSMLREYATSLIIDPESRTIQIPKDFLLGVYNDKDVKYVPFVIPRFYEENDFGDFSIQVNYIDADKNTDAYLVTDPIVEDQVVRFNWILGRGVFLSHGTISFIVCFRIADQQGNITKEFNTTIHSATVLEGLEVEETIDPEAYSILANIQGLEASASAARNQAVQQATLAAAHEQAIEQMLVDTPRFASSISDMTDTSQLYIYSGNEAGFQLGAWYYYNTDHAAWELYGNLNTDTTLSVSGMSADGKATGDALALKANISDVNVALTAKANMEDIANCYLFSTTVDDLISKMESMPLNRAFNIQVYSALSSAITNGVTTNACNGVVSRNTATSIKIVIHNNTATSAGGFYSGVLNTSTKVWSDLVHEPNRSEITDIEDALDLKVDKVNGKQLSTEDFTSELKTKLDGIATGANKTTVDSAMSSTSTNPVQNKIINTALTAKADANDVTSALALKANSADVTSALADKLDKTGDSKDLTTTFTSSDTTDANASSWTSVGALANTEKHSSIFAKVSQMFKNVRYLFKMLGTTDISSIGNGTVSGALSTLSTSTTDLTKRYVFSSTVDEFITKMAEMPLNRAVTVQVYNTLTSEISNGSVSSACNGFASRNTATSVKVLIYHNAAGSSGGFYSAVLNTSTKVWSDRIHEPNRSEMTSTRFTVNAESEFSNGVLVGYYDATTKNVRASFYFNSTTAISTTTVIFTIPEAYRPSTNYGGIGMYRTNQSSTPLSTYTCTIKTDGTVIQTAGSTVLGGVGFVEYPIG